MTEADYEALTAACDRLLRKSGSRLERVAVPWLHVLSEHPNNLAEYAAAFSKPRVLSGARHRFAAGVGAFRALYHALRSRDAGLTDTGRADVLFVSHHVGPAQAALPAEDFYFGYLPRALEHRGLVPLTLLLDQTLGNSAADSGRRCHTTRRRILMPPALSPRDELRLLRRARSARAALLADAAGASTTFERRVAHEAALRATAGRALLCLRLHEVVRRVCARARPRAIITTWEGHGWERLAFHAARSVVPNVLCIGYQHTIVFPRSHALKRPLGKMYDPDAVLTVGGVTHEIMRKAGGMPDTRLVVYGSHRRAPEARFRAGDASLRCLVIPEGLEQECLVLFDFALAAAAHMPCTTFVLRTHPVLPFAALEARHPRLRKLPRNVQVSGEKDIGADFARCDWALYRGSSAAVHAVLAGVRPLYVEREGELSIDPLFPMHGWRHHVETPLGLQELIRADMAMSAQLRREEWESAREFCNRYMVPPDFEVIWRLLGE